MCNKELLPHLFRTEYRKIVSVLCSLFGISHIEVAEDIVSDTFLTATETWSMKGVPQNPTAWLYTVAKNKTRNYLKRNTLFTKEISGNLVSEPAVEEEISIDLTERHINDSLLAMIFVVSDPCISDESQISLALNLLCGFSIQEIAEAFLTSKESIYKRISRAKEKLKEKKISIEPPAAVEIEARLNNVLRTVYLLFNEGYYSTTQNTILREDLCAEAMRLNLLLLENEKTNQPVTNALFSLMCFHASRFKARTNEEGEIILYDDQDTRLWNRELINQGIHYLKLASSGDRLSRYHLEAGIAYWHTNKGDSMEKWDNILQLYNHLLTLEYTPIAALNRTYALSKVYGNETAIAEAEKLNLTNHHFYHSLLGTLYSGIDQTTALLHFETAFKLANSTADKTTIAKKIHNLEAFPSKSKLI